MNRHCVVMGLVPGYPLSQVKSLANPRKVYNQCMNLIVRLAQHGLIHGDFNEFNLMINYNEEVTMIDFPQMVSVDHINADEYFERDVNCIRIFFEKKFNFVTDSWPIFQKDTQRTHNLDKEVEASGFTRAMQETFEQLAKEFTDEQEKESNANEDPGVQEKEENDEQGDEPVLPDLSSSGPLEDNTNDDVDEIEGTLDAHLETYTALLQGNKTVDDITDALTNTTPPSQTLYSTTPSTSSSTPSTSSTTSSATSTASTASTTTSTASSIPAKEVSMASTSSASPPQVPPTKEPDEESDDSEDDTHADKEKEKRKLIQKRVMKQIAQKERRKRGNKNIYKRRDKRAVRQETESWVRDIS